MTSQSEWWHRIRERRSQTRTFYMNLSLYSVSVHSIERGHIRGLLLIKSMATTTTVVATFISLLPLGISGHKIYHNIRRLPISTTRIERTSEPGAATDD